MIYACAVAEGQYKVAPTGSVATQFKPGHPPMGGRPAGTVEQLATKKLLAEATGMVAETVAGVLRDPEVQARFREGVRQIVRDDPRWFIRHFIVPILPKNIVLEGDGLDAVRDMYMQAVAMVNAKKSVEQSGGAGGGENDAVPSV